MPRLGSLAGNFRRLLIANLADVDHIRILAQDATQLAGESLPCFRVDFNLRHILDAILDRVLHRDHVLLIPIDLAQAGIQGRALAGPGGATHDQHAMGLLGDPVDLIAKPVAHAQLRQIDQLLRLVQDTHDQLFTDDAA